jgi:excinuclease ABC subunit B
MAEISEADSPLDESRFVRFPDSPFQLCQLFEPAGDQ